MNKVALIGRMAADAELRATQAGKSVCSFIVAVDRPGKESEADFIACVAWEKTAELIKQYFPKGTRIGLTGRIATRNYDDKDGNKRKVTEVIVEGFDFCERKQSGNTAPDGFAPYPADLPF